MTQFIMNAAFYLAGALCTLFGIVVGVILGSYICMTGILKDGFDIKDGHVVNKRSASHE